jgi:hypothetical protein
MKPSSDRAGVSYKGYLVMGVVAAAVSAATAAYIFWSRSRHMAPPVETVQELLDRCHDQVRDIEQRLNELRRPVGSTRAV